jgi:hypothetical protein
MVTEFPWTASVLAAPLVTLSPVLGPRAERLAAEAFVAFRKGREDSTRDDPSADAIMRQLGPVLTSMAQQVQAYTASGFQGLVKGASLVRHGHDASTAVRCDASTEEIPGGSWSFEYTLGLPLVSFSGGVLRVYDTLRRAEVSEAAATFREIYPDHDRLTLYPAHHWYGVSPVSTVDRARTEARLSVHGTVS